MVLLIGLTMAAIFMTIAGFFSLLFAVVSVMLDKPWVASISLLGIFLLVLIPVKGWTVGGTIVFMIAVFVASFLDAPGNPIYNAPYEKLFLNDGEYLTAYRIHSQPTPGESYVTAKNIIVDANGNELREAHGFLTYLYRVVLYSIIFGALLTLRGFIQTALPEKEKPANPDAAAMEATRLKEPR